MSDLPYVENPEAVGDPNQTPRVRLFTGDDVLDLAYRRAAEMRRDGKRVVLAVEPDAKLAAVRALAERWVARMPGVGDGLCGQAILDILDRESSDVV